MDEAERNRIMARDPSDPERRRLVDNEAKRRRLEKLKQNPVKYEEYLNKRRVPHSQKKTTNKLNKKKSEFVLYDTTGKTTVARMNMNRDENGKEPTVSLYEAAKFLEMDTTILMFKSMDGLAPPYIVGRFTPQLRYKVAQIQQFKETGTWKK